MNFLTDFADQAVVLPLAASVFVVLAGLGWRRGAASWALCVAGVLGVMLVCKLAVFACGWRMPWTGLSSPSGHTAASAVVYGGLLSLMLAPSVAGTLFTAIAGGCVALVFGLTRLALHVHTASDVVFGAVVGVAGAVAMRHLAGRRPNRRLWPRLFVAVLVVSAVFHGRRLEAETRIRSMALDIWPLSECIKPSPNAIHSPVAARSQPG